MRYHSGDELGHVGWAFDVGDGRVNAGSVENHSGHVFSPSTDDGFWTAIVDHPARPMRERTYDDVKYCDLPDDACDPVRAYRVVLWIKTQAYRAALRNCEDDVYDVLRAYGVRNLPAPVLHWLPNRWFTVFDGVCVPVGELNWDPKSTRASTPADPVAIEDLTPLRPPWRHPLRIEFHLFHVAKTVELVRAKIFRRR